MLLFFYYLLKVILVSGLLYGYYLVALKNKKFHQYNRFYLLITVLLSLIIPLLRIEFQTNSKQNTLRYLHLLNKIEFYVRHATIEKSFLLNYNVLALYTFLVITSIAFLLLAYRLARILLLIKGSPKHLQNSISFVFVKDKEAPFSFFKYIFWNDDIDINSIEGMCILRHELIHVEQKHSHDKLFVNLVLAAFWANPLFWFIRNELNMLHEFIADQKTISNGDTNAFATMLLTVAYPQHASFLTNSFFHSPVRRRLLMITTSNISRYTYFRRLMVLPLLAFISVLLAFRIAASNQEAEKRVLKNTSSGFVMAKARNGIEQFVSKEGIEQSDRVVRTSATIQKEARFVGGDEAWKKYLETHLNANVTSKDHVPHGLYTVKVKFVVTREGEIKDVSAIQVPANCPSCGEEAVQVIEHGPKWEPAMQDGKKVSSQNLQYISFLLE